MWSDSSTPNNPKLVSKNAINSFTPNILLQFNFIRGFYIFQTTSKRSPYFVLLLSLHGLPPKQNKYSFLSDKLEKRKFLFKLSKSQQLPSSYVEPN